MTKRKVGEGGSLESNELLPDGWSTLTSLVIKEIRQEHPSFETSLKNFISYANRLTNAWTDSLSVDQRHSFHLKKYRLALGGQSVWACDPLSFYECSDALVSFRAVIKAQVESTKATFSSAEPLPKGWETLASFVQTQVRKIAPNLQEEVGSFHAYVNKIVISWIGGIPDKNLVSSGIKRCRVSSQIAWSYDKEKFREGTAEFDSLASFIQTTVGATNEILKSVEPLPEGWGVLGERAKQEILKIDRSLDEKLKNIANFAHRCARDWIDQIPLNKRLSWGIKQHRVATRSAWSYDPKVFKEGSEGFEAFHLYVQEAVRTTVKTLDAAEPLPRGWNTLTSLVGHEIHQADPDLAKAFKNPAGLQARCIKQWIEQISDEDLESIGVGPRRVRAQIALAYDPKIFKEGLEAFESLRNVVKKIVGEMREKIDSAEPLPEGWNALIALAQNEIRLIDVGLDKDLSRSTVGGYAGSIMKKWIEQVPVHQSVVWGLKRCRVGGSTSWSYDPQVFKEGSEGFELFRAHLREAVGVTRERVDAAESPPKGWNLLSAIVKEKIRSLDAGLASVHGSFDAYVNRLIRIWMENVSEDGLHALGIRRFRLYGQQAWFYNPEIFNEDLEGFKSLHLFIQKSAQASRLALDSAEHVTDKWKVFGDLVRDTHLEITRQLGVEETASSQDINALVQRWVQKTPMEKKEAWGVRLGRIKAKPAWSYDPEKFKEGSDGFKALYDFIKASIVKKQTRAEVAESLPQGWKLCSDCIKEQIRRIDPTLEKDLSSFGSYLVRLTNEWIAAIPQAKLAELGIIRCRVNSQICWSYNPETFKEGAESFSALEAFIEKAVRSTRARLEAAQSMPEGWATLTSYILSEIRRIKPGIDPAHLASDAASCLKTWLQSTTSVQRSEWGIKQFRSVGGQIAWSYATAIFTDTSEARSTLNGFILRRINGRDAKGEKKSLEMKESILEAELIAFFKEVETGSTAESINFRSLIRVLGAARSIDILFSLHPKFRDIPIETVRGLLSDYLGETMLMSASGTVSDLQALEALPALETSIEQEFKEALVETIKDHCYKYYVAQKRAGSKLSAHDILDGYLSNLETELRSVQAATGKRSNGKTLLDHPLVGDAVMAVLEYFQDIWKIELPERVTPSLKDGREFPDLAQRMNINEVQDKKRMLIADEMGMGKSASAILSHEAAVQKARMEGRVLAPALILVPSNVLATWRGYLSSDNTKGGCFRAGVEPKIVEIESPVDFARVEGADYVIMTQERMNQRYQAISETQWSTIIVDEMHKLKSTDGVRSSFLRDIAQRQKADDRLVLLSGTPVPNTVRDIAVALTLLHPDQFKDTEPGVLAAQIIRGDLVEIRKYLLPRMQAKSLAESVELPPLKEGMLTCNLSPDDTLLYKTFVEEGDEFDRLSKLHFLRKWLLDPSLVDQQPDRSQARKGEKARRLEARINQAFDEGATHIVVFVNDIVDGILRPSKDIHDSTALIERIHVPADVKMAVIHGDIPMAERVKTQTAFQAGDSRWVLYVSGNTADVGVDYSAGDTTLFFNEPWTEYARQQQRSRVYRPGVQNAVTVESLVTQGTVEEGIHEYVQRKYHAVEKLLRGIPLTEIEKELLEKEDVGGSDTILSSEIAEQYLSAWDRLMHLFSASREIGEKNFTRFVERHGKEYADLYKDFRARSFAGNVNRVCGAVVQAYSKGRDRGADLKVLDAASGPEMLRRALPEDLAKHVTSMDLNPNMFGSASEGPTVVGGLSSMPFEKESFDVLTASLCLHYTGFQPKKGLIDRVKSFEEMQRVLKVGGWAVLALTPGKSLKNPEQFKAVMGLMGFDVVEEFTGSTHTYDNAFQLPLMTLRKRENVEVNEDLLSWTNKILEEHPEAFAFERGKRVGRHPRKMFGTCVIETTLQGNPTTLPIQVPMKEADQRIYEEEKRLMQQARNLKGIFREMRLIPSHALEQSKLSRVKMDSGSYALYSPFTTTQSGLLIGEVIWRNL